MPSSGDSGVNKRIKKNAQIAIIIIHTAMSKFFLISDFVVWFISGFSSKNLSEFVFTCPHVHIPNSFIF